MLRLVHIGIHNSANKNAGDTLLFEVVRKAFETALGDIEWHLYQVWELFDEAVAEDFNDKYDGIVIGGGGLLLRDQAGSDIQNSGWQWNSTVEAVRALSIPVVVYAIGYNRFRGQSEFPPIFTEHIKALFDKAAFFSLRNTGSIQSVAQYVDGKEAQRQYCPTTVLWQLYPDHRAQAQAHDARNDRVLAVNVAFDRTGSRFADQEQSLLGNLSACLNTAEERGWTIVNVCHKDLDRQFEPYLDAGGVSYRTQDLTSLAPHEIIDFYTSVDLVMGMRGHAQMIPFGLRRPIFSIISHNKMQYFLDDIGHPEWGAEIDDPQLGAKLSDFLTLLETDRATVLTEMAKAQDQVWLETMQNFQAIGDLLGRHVRQRKLDHSAN